MMLIVVSDIGGFYILNWATIYVAQRNVPSVDQRF